MHVCFVGVYVHTYVCVCMHVCVVMQKKITKCIFTCSIGMLNIGYKTAVLVSC